MPQGEERPTAWLFSLHNLSEEDLSLAVERVRQGERPDPGRALRASAKKEMGAIPVTESNQVPLPTPHLVGIAAANLLLTPLAGFAFWMGLREDRPIAAAQALRITLPITFALGALWLGMVAMRLLS